MYYRKFTFVVWTATGPITVFQNQFVTLSNIEVKLMRWYHLCSSYDMNSKKFEMVLDGEVISKGSFPVDMKPIEGNGTMIMGTGGADICREEVNDDCKGYFSGNIADFNVWSRILTTEEMMEFTTCKSVGKDAEIIDWSQANWNTNNVCNMQNLKSIIFEFTNELELTIKGFPQVLVLFAINYNTLNDLYLI